MIERRHWAVRADDGHRFELKVTGPQNPRAAILFLPAMGLPARYYASWAEALHESGLMLARCELRGVGTSSLRPKRGVDFGYRHILESDLPAAFETVQRRAPGLPIYLAGHSLGGQLALLYAASERPDLRAVILIACGSPYYRCWSGRQRLALRSARFLTSTLAATMGYVPGKRLGMGAAQEAATLMQDWSRTASTGKYLLRRSQVDYEAALGAYAGKVLSIAIADDDMACPRAVEFMLDKVPRATRRRVDVRLSSKKKKPSPHFRWVRDSESVVAAIRGEIESNASESLSL